MFQRAIFPLSLLLGMVSAPYATTAEPWSTYRANPQRTANLDGKAGPERPQLLWAVPSKEHHVASPVPTRDSLLVSGIGAFNVSSVRAVPIQPKSANAPAGWVKSTPYLKLPTVSSPCLTNELIIFGDGMHQTSGAILHCLKADSALPLWQLPVPGELVHLEGSPTIVGNRVFIGGGAAGVLCVAIDKASIDGKEYDLPTLAQMQADRWKELQAKYEEDKKKDPDFAVPPSEDQLLKAVPKVVWQVGKGKWHVDAPVTVVGDKVLVASAFLDKEQVGERALFCLDAKTGQTLWRTPLVLNPWGGAAVDKDTVIVTGSSVGYYYSAINSAKGDIVALDLATGKQKWRKEIPKGGIVSCAALADGIAVTTATDGQVRAYGIANGDLKWRVPTKAPLFAPPAIAAGVVYVGDLRGVLSAYDLKTGTTKWEFDLGTAPGVMAPGMIYGGVVVQDGKLFVATCNLEGPLAQKPTVIVCIGSK